MPKQKTITPGPVPQTAIDFIAAKGLEPAFSYEDVWKEEHLVSFTVAKVMEKDILADVQRSLTDALKEGTPFKAWAAGIEPMLDRSGWSAYGTEANKPNRLNTIYDTNMRSARSVGQWERIERTKEFRPFLRYALGPSARHRPEHASWAGTILPVDDPWWDDHTPQNAWRCKCHVIQESQRAVDRRGGPSSSAPPSPKVRVKSSRTGRSELVPIGIDPGFNFNPGKDRQKILATTAKQADAGHAKSTKDMKAEQKR